MRTRIDFMVEEGVPGEGTRAAVEGRPRAIVELRGISRRFGGVHALRDVGLTLQRGEILGLLGENGAGKIDPGQDSHRCPSAG